MRPVEDGYRLWLRYQALPAGPRLDEHRRLLKRIHVVGTSPTLEAARAELLLGVGGLLGTAPAIGTGSSRGGLVAGTPTGSREVEALLAENEMASELGAVGAEGFVLRRVGGGEESRILLAANRDVGVLYGAFALLRHLQTGQPLGTLSIQSAPKLRIRMLDHWDNLDGTVERGYAGASLWEWAKLPHERSPRYTDYARANASLGINGTVLTNVNASAAVLTRPYLEKVAALADVFRPYGIVVYLSARFSAPVEIGGLRTADPLDAAVVAWWRQKCHEIYALVPDFGGFLVKANSEGQPGPRDYGRSHAQGANLLAQALASGGGNGTGTGINKGTGVVLWRAFVYQAANTDDRAKQAFTELAPLDGQFQGNAFLQVKNGPIDFQPREPFHPLFGAMPHTPMLMELQITQEYLGQGTHLAYLGPLFEEALDADTHAQGPGSTVARAVSGLAGVANVGSDRDWCGHPFAAANWYAFGRLAWDPTLGAEAIADEWLRMTFGNDPGVVAPCKTMMMRSREAVVSYMTPLGLHHIMAANHHYGPGPWVEGGRPDWTAIYYHRADAAGIGFDRTASGSNAVSQYHPPWPEIFSDIDRCPEALLLWFHHVPWGHKMKSGRSLWDELCLRYQGGVEAVRGMQATWRALESKVDRGRFTLVRDLLAVQEQEACWWRDACVLYFQTFSKRPLPRGCERPKRTLDELRRIKHSFAPGVRPSER